MLNPWRLATYASIAVCLAPRLGAQTCEPNVLSAVGGQFEDVAGKGVILYAARGRTGIEIFDVSEPRTPLAVDTVKLDIAAYRIAVAGDTLLAVSVEGDVQSLDVTAPKFPLVGGVVTAPITNPVDIAADGSHFYVAANGGDVAIIDASDPDAPAFVGLLDGGFRTYDLHAAGGLLAIAQGSLGVRLYDLSAPALPSLVGIAPDSSQNVLLHGDALYASAEWQLYAIDITIPSSPQRVWQDSEGSSNQTGSDELLIIDGSLCWSAPNELRSYDLSDPHAPTLMEARTGWPRNREAASTDTCLVKVASGGLALYESAPMAPIPAIRRDHLSGYDPDLWVFGDRAIYASNSHKIVRLPDFELIFEWAPEGFNPWTNGDYYLTHHDDGLRIYDVRDGVTPTLLSTTPTGLAWSAAVHADGSRAYLTHDSTLLTIDWTNPAAPQIVATASLPWPLGVHGADGHILCGRISPFAVALVDVSDPDNPVLLSTIAGPSNTSPHMWFDGDWLILQNDGIRIYDASIPTAPRAIGLTPDRGAPYYDMALHAGRLYLGGNDGVTVWDLSDPSAPIEIARGGPIMDIFALELTDSGILVFGDDPEHYHYGPELYEIHDIESAGPVRFAEIHTPQVIDDAAFNDSSAYLAGDNSVAALDLSDPARPELGQILCHEGAIAIASRGDYLFHLNSSSLRVTKGLDPLSIHAVAQLDELPVQGQRPRMLHRGDLLYVCSEAGLIIIDISAPENPRVLSHTPGSIWSAALQNEVMCRAFGSSGIGFIDVSDPLRPVHLGQLRPVGYCYAVALVGDLAYVGGSGGRLHVVNASDPSNPVLLSTLDIGEDTFHRVVQSNNLLYCTTATGTLSVFDLSDPLNPELRGSTEPLADEIRPFIHQDQLYLGAGDSPSFMAVDPGCSSCPADFNGDGGVDSRDVIAFLNTWTAGDPDADLDGNGLIDTRDVVAFLNAWTTGC